MKQKQRLMVAALFSMPCAHFVKIVSGNTEYPRVAIVAGLRGIRAHTFRQNFAVCFIK